VEKEQLRLRHNGQADGEDDIAMLAQKRPHRVSVGQRSPIGVGHESDSGSIARASEDRRRGR
jgi:hypothetical protein